MVTSYNVIEGWLKRGKDEGKRWVVVICDTFDWGDYPVFFGEDEKDACLAKIASAKAGENMMRLMEVYDLNEDIDGQMGEHRAMHLPT